MTVALYPSRHQVARLEHFLFVGRLAFNRALESRIHWYKVSGKSLTLYQQFGDLAAIREADSFWSDVPSLVERDAIRRVDLAYGAFFRRIKAGENVGFPRFKGHNRWHSFSLANPQKVLVAGRVRVSGLNSTIRCRNLRLVEGEIKQQRIIRRAGKWFCQLVIDDGKARPALIPVRSAVGIDVGLKTFATLSNGDTVPNPRFGKKLSRQVVRAHRNVSRTVKGSRNRRKAVAKLQRVYAKIGDARMNFTHHTSKKIAAEHQLIAVEDLNIVGMAHGRLAKSILDACWGQLIWQLDYKAANAGGRTVKGNARGTSQECSSCGRNVPKTLSERVHHCPDCGLTIDRDLNAARNILKRALHSSDHPAPVGCTVMPVEGSVATPAKQEVSN